MLNKIMFDDQACTSLCLCICIIIGMVLAEQVKQWIAKMKMEAKAFYTGNSYLLAGVLLQKREAARKLDPEDLTDPLLAILTALH